MGKRTGRPRGRPAGAKSTRTRERERKVQEAAEVIASLIPGAFDGDSHAFLMSVYKDPTQPLATRLDAAKAAIGYEKPRLGTIEHKGDPENPLALAVISAVPRTNADPTSDQPKTPRH